MKTIHVLLGAAALIATAAGGYALGLRRATPPPPTGAPAAESAAAIEAPEVPRTRARRRPPQRVVEAPTDADGAETRTADALAALAASDAKERARGLLALAKYDHAQAVSRARALLGDPTMIQAASSVILSGGTPEDIGREIPAVRAALDRCACDAETKTAVTGTILQAANYASPASARKLAVELVTSRSPEARRAAIPLLQNLGANDAVPLLLAALDDPDTGVQKAAFATLRAFSPRDHGESAEAWRAWWRAANQGR